MLLETPVELTNAQYHAHPAVSKSHLDAIARSPLHYWEKYLNPDRQPEPPNPAFIIGSAAHSLVLEPQAFVRDFAVAPEGINRRTNEGKAQWAAFESQAGGKTIIDGETYRQAQAIAAAVANHPAAGPLLREGQAEVSVLASDPETGVAIKCRPDWLRDDGWIVDLKTTSDASPAGFGKSVANFRYHVQAAWYLDTMTAAYGEAPSGFIFVAVEKVAPYAVGVYRIEAEAIAMGRRHARRNLTDLVACREANRWPDFGAEIQSLVMPRWAV